MVTDELDFVLVSVITSFLLGEGSSAYIKVSTFNNAEAVIKRQLAAAKKSSRVKVLEFISFLLRSIFLNLLYDLVRDFCLLFFMCSDNFYVNVSFGITSKSCLLFNISSFRWLL